MKSLYQPLLATCLIAFVSACSSGGSEDTSAEQDNLDLFTYLQSDYFWNESLPSEINTSAWATMPEAMNALRAPEDKFSYVLTSDEYDDFVASIFFGYGFSHQVNSSNDGLLIRYTFEQGSAHQNGLRRGDTIIQVDDTTIADAQANQTDLSDLFGPNEDGYTIDVIFQKPDGSLVETQFSKSEIVANTVMAAQVKEANVNDETVKVGYLVFDSFKESSEQELETAFDMFDTEGVEELILDLRYNSGGRISIAQQLSHQIAGTNVANQIFVQYIHNSLQTGRNNTEFYSSSTSYEELNLDRVVVLASGATCSASELVINALDPFIEVIVIGDETCGKPVGMYPTPINDWVVFAINFQTQNAIGFGDYFNGLTPDCALEETIPGDWGTESEALLAEGLYYLENDSCSNQGTVTGQKLTQKNKIDFSQGPIKLRNAF